MPNEFSINRDDFDVEIEYICGRTTNRENKSRRNVVATELQIQNITMWHLHSHNRKNAADVYKNEMDTERK